MKNPSSILTSAAIAVACDRAHACVFILGISISLHCFHILRLRQLHPRVLTLLLTSTLALRTLPAITSDINLDKTTGTSPMLWQNDPLSKPSLLNYKPFIFILSFIAFSSSNIFLVEIAKVISEMVFTGKWRIRPLAFVVVASKTVLIIGRGVDVFIMPLEICRPAENGLLA